MSAGLFITVDQNHNGQVNCPAADGVSAARLEEEVVVVGDGVQIITRFPSAELFVTNPY